ncbi:hemolymph lipopolysaccharide-binding protein-like [Periplaneta americana]|uniref:hemolymph lipopolysaccharide-binding protein-like n=1 Tax=Periplaneta americana TaxID=6978 RepID=UPI0037E992F1
MFSLLLPVTILILSNVEEIQSKECSMQTPIKFTITSQRNQTGHWTAKVELEHEAKGDNPDVRPFELELEHRSLKCGTGDDIIQIEASIKAPPPRAGPGYELFPGQGYYKFHSKAAIWNDARTICNQEGAHLAIINSEEESKVLKDIFSRFPKIKDVTYNDFAFIGFHDLYTEGLYLTIYDKPLSSTGFIRWAGHQPDDAGGNEDCGSIHRSGGLNDLVCDKKHAFICEQEL